MTATVEATEEQEPVPSTRAAELAALSPDLELDERQLDGVAVAIAGEVVSRDRPLADGEAVVLVLPVRRLDAQRLRG